MVGSSGGGSGSCSGSGSMVGGGMVGGVSWFVSSSSGGGGGVGGVVRSGGGRMLSGGGGAGAGGAGGGAGGSSSLVQSGNVVFRQVDVQGNGFLLVTAGNGGFVAIGSNERNENEDIVAIDLLVTAVWDSNVAGGTVDGGAIEVNSLKVVGCIAGVQSKLADGAVDRRAWLARNGTVESDVERSRSQGGVMNDS